VAVLINKAMIEIPPKLADEPGSARIPGSAGIPAGENAHKGWYSRKYLPHFDQPGLVQSITFRLYDSVPESVIGKWRAELGILEDVGRDLGAPREIELRKRIASYEDAGHGECWLRDERLAALVENALLHFDSQRYRLIAWCIMPNHVHALIETWERWPLAGVLHSWKSFTASEANKLLGRTGSFWFREYHDRFIRDENHFARAVAYIEQNPVKAGLVKAAHDWKFGSARILAGEPRSPGSPGSAGIPAGEPPRSKTPKTPG